MFPFLSPSTIISTGINEHTGSHCFDIPHTGFFFSFLLSYFLPSSLFPLSLLYSPTFPFIFRLVPKSSPFSRVAISTEISCVRFFLFYDLETKDFQRWSATRSHHRLITTMMMIIRLIKPRLLICLSKPPLLEFLSS